MLGLKLPTDPRWAKLCETNLEEVLTDHAWCEQKAATNCINLIINNSEKPELVSKMLEIAQINEEVVKQNQNNSGGAQYLFKNVDTNFWLDVVNLSHELFSKITDSIMLFL